MKSSARLIVFFFGASLVAVAASLRAQQPSASPTPSASGSATASQAADEEEEMTKEVGSPSPDGKFAFLFGRGEYEKSIDLIDKKTGKVLQHIDDQDMATASYRVLWGPDSKRFALMTRMGHPNQGVTVYFLTGDKFKEIELPELTAEIPARIRAGKSHPHVATNNWQEAEKWNKDGSLVLTIDNTIDGEGHTASAVRTVVVGFEKSRKPKILKSTVKYDSRNDNE